MDFQLTEDQLALQQGLRSFCEGRVSAEQLPELEKTGGIERALWQELAEMGVFNLCRPESRAVAGRGTQIERHAVKGDVESPGAVDEG